MRSCAVTLSAVFVFEYCNAVCAATVSSSNTVYNRLANQDPVYIGDCLPYLQVVCALCVRCVSSA